MDLWHFFGDLHPKLVHFPLVLLLAGLLFDAVGLAVRSARCHWAAKILTSAGTVLLLVTFICGIYAEVWAGRAGVPQDAIELHELFANIASWGFVILAAWRLFLRDSSRKALLAYTALGLAWYGLMILTAHLGGALVYDYGAAVTGAQAGTPMSLHDLNTLATRQTDLNLRYSEMMHHIFGYLTLALAGSLFAHALLPRRADRLRWVGPMLLLLGGVFLFFCADLDLYRLTDLRQLLDREVQLHKTIAIVLTVAGVVGLRRSKRNAPGQGPFSRVACDPLSAGSGEQARPLNAGSERADEPHADEPASSSNHFQAKMVAVMALIGGGLLFTHVHTVAPYANVAAGVYVAHVTLGTVALLIGATRLLSDGLPRYRRALSIAFSLLLCIESILLITYNEGLPWYVGYGRYNRWGPHGGTVAPYGDRRAELTFDEKFQRLDVYVLDRFDDKKPIRVPASQLDVLIARGYQETVVPVDAIPDETGAVSSSTAGASHFTAIVPFLKDVPAFCARMALPMPSHGGMTMKMGYFDPWVTPVIAAVPPNEVARFQCPMHEGIRATEPGECPLCHMPLVPITRGIRTTLHDDGYDLGFAADPVASATATDAHDVLSRHLRFTPTHSGTTLRDLAIVHEHPLHLIVVSDDLRFFDHVHPVPQPDGSLSLDYTFPSAGRYLLFADLTPQGARSQVFRLPVTIGNPAPAEPAPPQPQAAGTELLADAVPATSIEQDPSITVELVSMPRALVAGPHAQLVFRLTRNGQPLTDLQPYLGAMGHCVILSQDTQTYLHCHPEQFRTPAPDDRGGPEVVFHARFPRPGTYKLWAQFNHEGRILVAPFTLHVGRPILPPKVMAALFDD